MTTVDEAREALLMMIGDAGGPEDVEQFEAAVRAEERARLVAEAIVHINDGAAHDDAMAWSRGHTEGYDEARADAEAKLAALREAER